MPMIAVRGLGLLRSRLAPSAAPALLRGARTLGLRCATPPAGALSARAPLASRLGCRARSAVAEAASSSAAPAVAAEGAAVAAAVSPAVGWWLLGTTGAVFGMVVLGGITRLTRSGLSMTDWRPQGSRLPADDEAWQREFEKYQSFPEYQRLHKGTGMTLDDFKYIYWFEWAHRMAGRSIGLVFGLPLAAFAARGMIPRRLAPTLVGLLVLGGSQGLVGWWMVKSGLEEKAIDQIEGGLPSVSPYRLAAHLTTAFAIYSLLLYTGLGVLQPREGAPATAALRAVQGRLRPLALLIGVTAVSGAFVAGMQAGLAFNTFPLMEGRIVPEGYFALTPAYRNFFESVPSVQLHHRALALSTLAASTATWISIQRLPLPPRVRLATDALMVVVVGQVSLGVATLLSAVPVHLGSAHQAGALTVFTVTLVALHACRVPHAGAVAARWAARPR